jgi:hypothetical protein
VVLIGWALGKPMDLNFEIFMVCLLVLSILVVGNFLRDGESNWLEGALLVVSTLSLWAMLLMLTKIGCVCDYCHRVLVLPEPRRCHVQRVRGRSQRDHERRHSA